MQSSTKHDLVVSVVFLSLSLFVVIATRDYPVAQREVGVRTFPLLLSLLLGAVALVQLFGVLRRRRAEKDPGGAGAERSPRSSAPEETGALTFSRRTLARLVSSFVAIAAYVAIVRYAGFIFTSILFLTAATLYFGERRPWLIALFSLGAVVVVYLLFGVIAGVPFPRGPVEELLFQIGVI